MELFEHANAATAAAFPEQLKAVKRAAEDFEWYPTTREIIAALVADVRQEGDRYNYSRANTCRAFLDVGAGNGKVLDAVREIEGMESLHAIEKSNTHLHSLPADVFILGVDFWHTSLLDKQLGFVFSNPPYSEFAEWSAKILREAPGDCVVYLVIPERWERSELIAREIEARKLKPEILGRFDFESAEDRAARCKVHLIKVKIPDGCRWMKDSPDDPFVRFFNESFPYPETKEEKPFAEQIEEAKIVYRLNFIEALCRLFDLRMAELQENYRAVCTLSPDILKEFEISREGLITSLRMKLAACSGVLVMGSTPAVARRSFRSADVSALLSSPLRRTTISRGVAAGARVQYQIGTSKFSTPASFAVGTVEMTGDR